MSRDTDKLMSSIQDEISEFESTIEENQKYNKILEDENDF